MPDANRKRRRQAKAARRFFVFALPCIYCMLKAFL